MTDDMVKISEIPFSEVEKRYCDGDSAVLMNMPESLSDKIWENIGRFLSDKLGFSKGKTLIGAYRITGAKTDGDNNCWLLVFDHPEKHFDPFARVQLTGLKWTSDFVDNYRDYFDEGLELPRAMPYCRAWIENVLQIHEAPSDVSDMLAQVRQEP